MDSKECANLIRSVLNSMESVSVTALVADFLELVGTEIPYKRFGFSNLTDYLNSIPWILQVNAEEDAIEVAVSRKSAHIHRMVQAEGFGREFLRMKDKFSSRSL